MREHATTTHAKHTQSQTDAKRFRPLCHLGYQISGRDDKGFTATDPASGETIRRLTFEAFDKAVRTAGLTRAARSKLLEKRATPDHQARQTVENMRLHLLARERREVVPTKRTPKTKARAAAPARRRVQSR